MKGTIVAINRHLGTVVVEAENQKCAVMETLGRITAEVGDLIQGEWTMDAPFTIFNLTRENEMQMTLQSADISRYEAVSRTTVI